MWAGFKVGWRNGFDPVLVWISNLFIVLFFRRCSWLWFLISGERAHRTYTFVQSISQKGICMLLFCVWVCICWLCWLDIVVLTCVCAFSPEMFIIIYLCSCFIEFPNENSWYSAASPYTHSDANCCQNIYEKWEWEKKKKKKDGDLFSWCKIFSRIST